MLASTVVAGLLAAAPASAGVVPPGSTGCQTQTFTTKLSAIFGDFGTVSSTYKWCYTWNTVTSALMTNESHSTNAWGQVQLYQIDAPTAFPQGSLGKGTYTVLVKFRVTRGIPKTSIRTSPGVAQQTITMKPGGASTYSIKWVS